LEILDAIPRNAAGKILKEQLRTQFAPSSAR
jgi:acyl-CoA synthetase (AMP-forming)/AMP-acid ligase II